MGFIAYGLRIESEVRCPGLPTGSGAPDVIVRYAQVQVPPGAPGAERTYIVEPGQLRVYWAGVGTFLIRDGGEVLIDPVPGVEESLLRLYLLGPALAVVLHQRRHLVLHASVVLVGNEVVGFLGEKGWGKSTTAAALNARGHALLADDILAVHRNAQGMPIVQPGPPQFKLWPESAAASFGDDPSTLARLHSRIEKRVREANGDGKAQPVPLGRLYLLDRGETLESIPMARSSALLALIRHSFLSHLMLALGAAGENFKQCAWLAQRIPVHRLQRPKNLNALAEIVRLIESETGSKARPLPLDRCDEPTRNLSRHAFDT